MKRLILIAAALLACVGTLSSEPQVNKTVALTTGTPVRVIANRTMANSLFVQVAPGASSVVYVLYVRDRTITCDSSDSTQVVAILGPGTGAQPGASFTYPSNNVAASSAGGFDASLWCVQGSTGDSVIISFDKRN